MGAYVNSFVLQPRRLLGWLCTMALNHKLDEHAGGTQIIATVQKTYYWPHTAADVTSIVRTCTHCSKPVFNWASLLTP